MPRIVKSNGVQMNKEPVKIEEIVSSLQAQDLPLEDSTEGEDFVILGEEGKEILREGKTPEGLQQEEVKVHPVQAEIIQSAMAEASRIVENAVREGEALRNEVLAKAQHEADTIRADANKAGQHEGFGTVVENVHTVVEKLVSTLAELEGNLAGFQAEYESQLKWFSAEIATKVLNQKVAEDDSILANMVSKAVRAVRKEAWVRVDVASEMLGLIEELSRIYAENAHIDVNPVNNKIGMIQVETPSGVVDVSVETQMENLKEYFKQIKE